MAITTMQQIKDAFPGQSCNVCKTGFGVITNDMTYSFWGVPGNPAAGADPSSGLAGNIPTSATLGAVPFTNPASGATYLAQLNMAINRTAMIWVYDRLWHDSGINMTATTPQTINSVALTRPDANGVQAELWWQIYTSLGALTPVVTISYTNSANVAGRTATNAAFLNMNTRRSQPFQLDVGDTGVKSIQTYTANASFVSGTWGLVLRRKLAEVYVPGLGGYTVNDALGTALPTIPDNACIEFLCFYSTATQPTLSGDLVLING